MAPRGRASGGRGRDERHRAGRVFVRVHERRDLDDLRRRLGESSLAVYEALLDELDG
jgi:hypothetical protein